jgi:hypothetical protein
MLDLVSTRSRTGLGIGAVGRLGYRSGGQGQFSLIITIPLRDGIPLLEDSFCNGSLLSSRLLEARYAREKQKCAAATPFRL